MDIILITLWRIIVSISYWSTFFAVLFFVIHLPSRIHRLVCHNKIFDPQKTVPQDIDALKDELSKAKRFIQYHPLWLMPLLIVLALVSNMDFNTHVFENDIRSRSYGTFCYTVKLSVDDKTLYLPADVQVERLSGPHQELTVTKIFLPNGETAECKDDIFFDMEIDKEYDFEWYVNDKNNTIKIISVSLLNKKNYSPMSSEKNKSHPISAIMSLLAILEITISLFERRKYVFLSANLSLHEQLYYEKIIQKSQVGYKNTYFNL